MVSVLKWVSWLSFMLVFSFSAWAVSVAFFSKAPYLLASLSACTYPQTQVN